MKLRPDQQRVASLLKETITLMCRNGLIFDSQFCIEATIGVTLDDKDVFVVSLNEVIGKDERSDVESNGGDPLPGSPEKKPLAIKRGRPRKKTPKVTPKKAARKNKAEDSWGESADDFDDYASSDDASPPAKKSKDLLQEELNMTCDAGENVAVKQELQYDSSNVSRVPEEGEELLFSLEGQQSSELQLQQASNSMSESTSQVPSTSQQSREDLSGNDQHSESIVTGNCRRQRTPSVHPVTSNIVDKGINNSEQVECPQPGCSKKYGSNNSLNEHLRTKHKPQHQILCEKCDKMFASKKLHKEHCLHMHDYHGYMCKSCGIVFKWRSSLHAHLKSRHPTS